MTEPKHQDTTNNSLVKFLSSPIARALFALILVIIIGLIRNADGSFFKFETHRDMLRHISRYGILACGMTIVIITAGIDLSVGSLLGITAVIFSLTTLHLGWGAFLAIPLTLLAGVGCGLMSGTLIGKFKLQPFIATLAMMVFARGVAKYITGGEKITRAIQKGNEFVYVDLPGIFAFLNSRVLNDSVAVVTIIFLICLLISWLLLDKLRWGRYLYAIGGNEEAARLSGVPVRAMKLLAYGISGFFCAVAGMCQAASEQQGDPEAGQTYELTAIAIVVIGGTNLMGGRGSIWLTLIGALTIGYLEKILSINAVSEAGRLMLTGAIIVGAVLFQGTKKR
ncbi:MAG: ABC transporter permease [Sedimentisphaerales bacterium]|nr:ABC transporter permease [Sedimentisphaerales bacterium]